MKRLVPMTMGRSPCVDRIGLPLERPRRRASSGQWRRAGKGPRRHASPRFASNDASDGFTLMELLIALALLAVLLAIALPAYREQVAHARRSELQTALLEDAGYMQRYYAANNAFSATPPPRLTWTASPPTGPPAYEIVVTVPPGDPTVFTLTATRAGAMAGDRCGDFTYDSLGRRGLVLDTPRAGLAAADCWR
jgi:type IV pilus assembly protein PilE